MEEVKTEEVKTEEVKVEENIIKSNEEVNVSNDDEPTVEELQEELKKTKEDRDNYRQAVLSSKKKDRQISEEKTLSKKEKKELGKNGVKNLEEQRDSEKKAIASFIEKNQEYIDDQSWQNLLAVYVSPKETTSDKINLALENAHVAKLYKEGKLLTEKQIAEKINKAQTDEQVNALSSSGNTTGSGSNNSASNESNDGAVKMAKKFSGNDPKKVSKMDDKREFIIDINKL